jgi:hypothetical protein
MSSTASEVKLCECGCGQQTAMASGNSTRLGWVKGQPKRFINGHNSRRHGAIKHGMCRTPEYRSYIAARARCANPNDELHWKDYGGRGIKFLFASFEQFYAHIGPRPAGTTLDRIENDGNYEPGNVKWSTLSEQQKNQRRRKCHS